MHRFIFILWLFPLFLFGAEGLIGTYYSSDNFTNQTGQRVDETINFEWGTGRPTGMVNDNNDFSIIWDGFLIVPETANYTFHVAHDDFLEVIIDGNSHYSSGAWTGGSNNFREFTINNLQAGHYPIRLRFIENSGGAYVKLAWSNNASIGSRTIIPKENLSTDEPLQIVLNYRMDECSWNGTANEVKDYSGNDLHATAINSDGSLHQKGIINPAGTFDRTKSQYIQLPTFEEDTINFNDGFTITTWAKFSDTIGSWERIFDFGNGADSNNIFLSRNHTTNNLTFGIHDSISGDNYLTASDALGDTDWHFFAISCQGATCRLYKDGSQIAASTSMKIPSHTKRSRNYIAKSNWSDAYFESRIDEFKLFDKPLTGQQISIIYNNELVEKNYNGEIRNKITCEETYCSKNNLSNGFHVITPPNFDDNKSFEIFCYDERDFIALPNRNDFNNLVFKSDSLGSTDYYDQATNNSDHFQAIEINALDMGVRTGGSTTPVQVGNFKVMGSGFSNINLIGTPFAIDWANTDISHCNEDKLRKAYYGQAVKINTLDYDNKAICQINGMKIKLLDDYNYLTLDNEEVLENTCKLMAEAIPSNILDSKSIKGHYWIKPNNNDRSHASNDITKAIERPLVAYCWYQTDLDWAWTFLLAMDGERTIRKSDLTDKADTCSKMGLFPFVPNTEDTFTRVRVFLKENKNQWDNYTGTIQEKLNALYGNNYYLSTERNQLIWPYGSFGVYFPTNGNNPKGWGGSATNVAGWMSGSPMHNITDTTTDYDRYTDSSRSDDFYSYGTYSNTDTIDTPLNRYEYKDTMGAKGWVSILGANDLNKTEEWFISRAGAGQNITGSTTYFEPNGNYHSGCWLNYLFDDDGRVRHNDDWNCNYPYYDYMCMAEDNYDFTKRYIRIQGRFNIIEPHVTNAQALVEENRKLQTKIAGSSIRFDGIFLNNTGDGLAGEEDQNASFGLFLSEMVSEEEVNDIYFVGENVNGNKGFDLSTGRFPVNIPTDSAYKELSFRFKHCKNLSIPWTDCWTSGLGGIELNSDATRSDSNDSFAIRPDRFNLTFDPNPPNKVAQKEYGITFDALNANGNPTANYNETVPFTHEETNTSCITGIFDPSPSTINFTEGTVVINDVNYSEAGVLNIKVKEEIGLEFAKVDAGDTPEAMRLISPYDVNITFVPDRFDISTALTQGGGSFVYINPDINVTNGDERMSAVFDVNLTARGEDGKKLLNYSGACYAKDSNLTLIFQDLNITPANGLNAMLLYETNTTRNFNTTTNDTNITLETLSKSIFDDGDANLTLRINFDRNMSTAVNPFKVNITSFNFNDADASGLSTPLDHNATFYYGRVHAPIQRGRSPMTTRLYYEIYCDDCNLTDFNITGNETTGGWFINTHHDNELLQGHVTNFHSIGSTQFNKGAGPVDNAATQLNDIVDGNETIVLIKVNDLHDRVEMTPSKDWLLYNIYNESATTNDFDVEFFGRGQWAGQGTVDTEGADIIGKSLEDNSTSERTNRRIAW